MVIRQSAIQAIRKLTCQHSENRYRESLKKLITKEPLNQQRETRKSHTDLDLDSQRAAARSTRQSLYRGSKYRHVKVKKFNIRRQIRPEAKWITAKENQ